MAFIKQAFPLPETYNGLPHIREVSSVPQDDTESLEMLRSLLAKYNVPGSISIRLIHKHFDIYPGEAMMIKTLDVPDYGHVSILRPTKITPDSALTGLHFFVATESLLQAYEYCSAPTTDVSGLKPFFIEFCQTVMKHGLQEKFGLKIDSKLEPKIGWTEFEFEEHRGTIMVPEGLPTPSGHFDVLVNTEFHAERRNDMEACHHTSKQVCAHCKHCSHGKTRAEESSTEECIVGEELVETGSAFYDFCHAIRAVWDS